jgi:hypothetical protein
MQRRIVAEIVRVSQPGSNAHFLVTFKSLKPFRRCGTPIEYLSRNGIDSLIVKNSTSNPIQTGRAIFTVDSAKYPSVIFLEQCQQSYEARIARLEADCKLIKEHLIRLSE